jgi:RimJ/RimL family protein N-acetyltransferase
VELRTERLILRQWRDDDVDDFVAMGRDAAVMEYFPGLMTEEQSRATAESFREQIAERGWGLWAVEPVDGPLAGRFIGFTGLSVPRFEAFFMPAVEIGWRLTPAAWGFGFATEAARASVAYGFETLGLDEIVSFTTETNRRSRAVMERLGMTHDPADDFDHPSLPGHRLQRHVLYRLGAPQARLGQGRPPARRT